jgi:uncharacterized Zn finger protein
MTLMITERLEDLPLGGDVAARGQQLAPRVRFDTVSSIQVIARVPDLAEHRVRLLLRADGLDWDCDCEDAKRAPCMHVAAVAEALRQADAAEVQAERRQ